MFPYNVSSNVTNRNDFNYYKVLGADGDFKKKYGLYREIDTLINVLSTPKGSYPGDPQFGSLLHTYMFDETDEITKMNIENEVRYIVETYLNNTTIQSLDITPYKDLQGFQLRIWLRYGEEVKEVPLSIYKGMIVAEV